VLYLPILATKFFLSTELHLPNLDDDVKEYKYTGVSLRFCSHLTCIQLESNANAWKTLIMATNWKSLDLSMKAVWINFFGTVYDIEEERIWYILNLSKLILSPPPLK
jgi:hypothetical protein